MEAQLLVELAFPREGPPTAEASNVQLQTAERAARPGQRVREPRPSGGEEPLRTEREGRAFSGRGGLCKGPEAGGV